jgi:hypothetical protein
MSTTVALYKRPTRTHRGLATYTVECGKRVDRALFDENPRPGKPTPANELIYVIRRRGVGLPRGHSLAGYYGIREQREHIERAHEDYGTLITYASHSWPCPCDNCNLDDDGGDP